MTTLTSIPNKPFDNSSIGCITYFNNSYTVKPVYNDHPQDPKCVAVADRWSLFRGSFMSQKLTLRPKKVVVVDKWSLFRGGFLLKFDCTIIY